MKRLLGLVLGLGLLAGQALADEWKKLVEPDDLDALLGGETVVIDIRAPGQFALGHIPGALNAPYPTWRGPKENPGETMTDARLTERMRSLGLDRADRVVVTYHGKDATEFGAAARVYWTLKSAGLTEIAILNGGLVSWVKSGRTLAIAPGVAEPSNETFSLARDWMVDRDGVRQIMEGRRQAVLIDARPMSFWRGKRKHPAAKGAGTLLNSLQLTHDSWFTEEANKVSAADVVRSIATKAGYNGASDRDLVSFCNTGHWAATNWFALSEVAGIEGVKLYPESMVGWANSGGELATGK